MESNIIFGRGWFDVYENFFLNVKPGLLLFLSTYVGRGGVLWLRECATSSMMILPLSFLYVMIDSFNVNIRNLWRILLQVIEQSFLIYSAYTLYTHIKHCLFSSCSMGGHISNDEIEQTILDLGTGDFCRDRHCEFW